MRELCQYEDDFTKLGCDSLGSSLAKDESLLVLSLILCNGPNPLLQAKIGDAAYASYRRYEHGRLRCVRSAHQSLSCLCQSLRFFTWFVYPLICKNE